MVLPPADGQADGVTDVRSWSVVVGVVGVLLVGGALSMHRQAFGAHRFQGYTPGYRRRMMALAVLGVVHLVAAAVLLTR